MVCTKAISSNNFSIMLASIYTLSFHDSLLICTVKATNDLTKLWAHDKGFSIRIYGHEIVTVCLLGAGNPSWESFEVELYSNGSIIIVHNFYMKENVACVINVDVLDLLVWLDYAIIWKCNCVWIIHWQCKHKLCT